MPDYSSTTGTTTPIFIPKPNETGDVKPGESYFLIKVVGAQAAFSGPIWERVDKLIITSQVSIDHPVLGGEPLRAIQRSRAVTRNGAVQLGLSPNLIKLVPATMKSVGVSIEFILDVHNRLNDLSGLINDDAFVAAASLAPGGAAIAKTIGGVAQKLIQTLFNADERKPILQFSGDFNIPTGDLKAGYYAIIGTRDESRPLPRPMPTLSVNNNELYVGGGVATQWSYVILEVKTVPVRTRDLNEGAAWDEKLRQAEAEAERATNDYGANTKDKERAWEVCRSFLKEAQTLILSDINYLRREADDIIKSGYARCREQIFGEQVAVTKSPPMRGSDSPKVDDSADRRLLGIAPDEDLADIRTRYARQVFESRKVLDQD